MWRTPSNKRPVSQNHRKHKTAVACLITMAQNRYWTWWNMPTKKESTPSKNELKKHTQCSTESKKNESNEIKTRGNRHKKSTPAHTIIVVQCVTAASVCLCLGVGSKWIRTLLSVISQVIYWNREYLKGNGCSRLLLFSRTIFFFALIFLLLLLSFHCIKSLVKKWGFEMCSLSTANVYCDGELLISLNRNAK